MRKRADGIGPELHGSGDLAAEERYLSDGERYPVEEGTRYPGRDHPDEDPRGHVDFADVGELLELSDMHDTSDLVQGARRPEEKIAMTPQQFLELLGQEVADLQEQGPKQGGMSPSRDPRNMPATVVDEARIRLENRENRLEEQGGELSHEDEGTLHLLEQETDRRDLTAGLRALGQVVSATFGESGSDEGDDDEDDDDRSGDDDSDGDEADEDEAIGRIGDALEMLESEDLPPAAQHQVDQISDAIDDLLAIQDDEGDVDADDDSDGDLSPIGGEGSGALSGPSKEVLNVPMAVLDDVRIRARHAPTHTRESAGDLGLIERETARRGVAASVSVEDADLFAARSSQEWGHAVVTAALAPEVTPSLPAVETPGIEKTAAEDLPFDVFERSSDAFRSAERSLAAMAINHRSEQRARFAPPSPSLVAAAQVVLRKAMAGLRAHYTIDMFDLERVVSRKIAAADGTIVDGELVWHLILADHARRRRGAIDLVVPIAGGTPVGDAFVLADGRRLPLTRRALDAHLNIRREDTRWSTSPPAVERAFLEE